MTTQVTAVYTPEAAQREALGKSIGLIGTTVGAVGAMMALSVNPSFKGSGGKHARILGILALGGLAAWAGVAYMKKNNITLVTPRGT